MTGPREVSAALPEWNVGPQSRTDIVRYQGASGDFNPIHHDDEFARAGGMAGAFSVGMLQAGYLGTYCTDLYGPESVRRIKVRFSEQVWPGDVLVCSGRVVLATTSQNGTQRLELELAVRREGGGVAVTAEATVVVPATS
ncbi:MaoC/PaaZ C-terminal domain-containing protein [Pseudonocardia sp.]|uniref:MaoC/PaaZ C-terminal domain-containing protein n=1 Tax=Pseudonocardia sp. TaxID=60912 RepID=UPI003D139BD6